MSEEVEFDGRVIANMIETVKKNNSYDSKTVAEKMQIRAAVELEFADKLMTIVRSRFADLPDYDPMFQGQQIQAILERLYPDCASLMQLRWIPFLLSPETTDLFPPFIESPKYVQLRQTAYRLLNEADQKQLTEEERQHLTNICDGRMPPGIFSTHHSAYLICDLWHNDAPLNLQAVAAFRKEQTLPPGSKPKTAEEIKAELNV